MGPHKLYLRDISQAYVQSTTNLNREFYVRPPRELQDKLGIGRDSVLKVLKPLYGVPEAGNHWFKTYHSHHVQQLHMDQSTYDPCLLQSNEPFGIVGLQTDDTLSLADETFAEASFDLSFAAQVINSSEGDAKDRLMIDVMCPRQAYERRQITKVKWINGDTNLANAMTKGKPCTAQLIDRNRVKLQAVGVG